MVASVIFGHPAQWFDRTAYKRGEEKALQDMLKWKPEEGYKLLAPILYPNLVKDTELMFCVRHFPLVGAHFVIKFDLLMIIRFKDTSCHFVGAKRTEYHRQDDFGYTGSEVGYQENYAAHDGSLYCTGRVFCIYILV